MYSSFHLDTTASCLRAWLVENQLEQELYFLLLKCYLFPKLVFYLQLIANVLRNKNITDNLNWFLPETLDFVYFL